jgi:hypothetical protein
VEFSLNVDCLTDCSGTYDILVGGKKYGSYDNSGSFGELALMYNQPRAATIIATSAGILWAMVNYAIQFCTHIIANMYYGVNN